MSIMCPQQFEELAEVSDLITEEQTLLAAGSFDWNAVMQIMMMTMAFGMVINMMKGAMKHSSRVFTQTYTLRELIRAKASSYGFAVTKNKLGTIELVPSGDKQLYIPMVSDFSRYGVKFVRFEDEIELHPASAGFDIKTDVELPGYVTPAEEEEEEIQQVKFKRGGGRYIPSGIPVAGSAIAQLVLSRAPYMKGETYVPSGESQFVLPSTSTSRHIERTFVGYLMIVKNVNAKTGVGAVRLYERQQFRDKKLAAAETVNMAEAERLYRDLISKAQRAWVEQTGGVVK